MLTENTPQICAPIEELVELRLKYQLIPEEQQGNEEARLFLCRIERLKNEIDNGNQ